MNANSVQRATWIVVPAFRESAAIGAVVERLRSAGWQVVVVDDGSKDDTGALAARAGAWVVTLPVNLGQGAALRTGFRFAQSRAGMRFVVTFDADGQHDVAAITTLLAPLIDGSADVALGSRFLRPEDAGHVPFLRRGLLRLATRLARWTTGLAVTDSHNGLRAISAAALARMQLTQNRMAHASEIQHEINRLGLRFREVPVDITYTNYSRAKGQHALDAVSVLWDLLVSKAR